VVNDQLHSPAASPLKEPPVPTEEVTVWAPELFGIFGEDESFSSLSRNLLPRSPFSAGVLISP